MWWDYQNLNQRRKKSGNVWFFRVWHEVIDRGHVARIFFWDELRKFTGVVLFPPGANAHISRLKVMIQKLMADPALRAAYQRDLRFPLERHYDYWGAFPEENGPDDASARIGDR